jgi:hypothetical protein
VIRLSAADGCQNGTSTAPAEPFKRIDDLKLITAMPGTVAADLGGIMAIA